MRDPTVKPACMTDAEWETWNAPVVSYSDSPYGNARRGYESTPRRSVTTLRPISPCVGCPLSFHEEQLALGTCDGKPVHLNGRPIKPGDYVTERRRARWREYGRAKRARAKAAAA